MELERSLRLARSLWDDFAGKSARPLQLAEALDTKPSSGGWRELCGASIAYGLTEGGYNASEIRLTDLGRRAVAPREEGDDLVAARQAAMHPRVCNEFFSRYSGMKFPSERVATSVLVDMGVPKERADRCLSILRSNGEFCSLLKSIKGEFYVALDSPPSRPDDPLARSPDVENVAERTEEIAAQADPETSKSNNTPAEPQGPRQIFVAHGKKRDALEAIKGVLDKFKVPYVVAIDEPHSGRPISEKVAQLMRSSSAGIFIFTPDEVFLGEDGEKIYRPSENVVFELGAGSVLWGRKIVILKEKSVSFASDYRDIGYIEFSTDSIKSIGMELLTELIGLDFVKLQVG
jgi:predicted nucleotide-binding protein